MFLICSTDKANNLFEEMRLLKIKNFDFNLNLYLSLNIINNFLYT